MKHKWKIALFCIASIILNLLTSILIFDVCHVPLFLDTIFTVAIVFYFGLVPGLIVGFFYNIFVILLMYKINIFYCFSI